MKSIAQKTKPTIIGITESKLDGTIPDSEVEIDGYTIFRCDRNRNGGGVALYIDKKVGSTIRGTFSSDTENVFIDILLPKTKPILVGIAYNPFQPEFLDNLSSAISNAENFDNQEVYLLGDFNINLYHNQKYILYKNKVLSSQEILKNITSSTDAYQVIRYQEFSSLYGLKQLIKTPTRITTNKSSLLDHIYTNKFRR